MHRILDTGFQEHFRKTSLLADPMIWYYVGYEMMKLLLERGFFCGLNLTWWEDMLFSIIGRANAPMLELVHKHCPPELPRHNSQDVRCWCVVSDATVTWNNLAILNILLDHDWHAGSMLAAAAFHRKRKMVQGYPETSKGPA
jgi:hypothetical protein